MFSVYLGWYLDHIRLLAVPVAADFGSRIPQGFEVVPQPYPPSGRIRSGRFCPLGCPPLRFGVEGLGLIVIARGWGFGEYRTGLRVWDYCKLGCPPLGFGARD